MAQYGLAQIKIAVARVVLFHSNFMRVLTFFNQNSELLHCSSHAPIGSVND